MRNGVTLCFMAGEYHDHDPPPLDDLYDERLNQMRRELALDAVRNAATEALTIASPPAEALWIAQLVAWLPPGERGLPSRAALDSLPAVDGRNGRTSQCRSSSCSFGASDDTRSCAPLATLRTPSAPIPGLRSRSASPGCSSSTPNAVEDRLIATSTKTVGSQHCATGRGRPRTSVHDDGRRDSSGRSLILSCKLAACVALQRTASREVRGTDGVVRLVDAFEVTGIAREEGQVVRNRHSGR